MPVRDPDTVPCAFMAWMRSEPPITTLDVPNHETKFLLLSLSTRPICIGVSRCARYPNSFERRTSVVAAPF